MTRVEVWDVAPTVTVLEATVDAPVHAPVTLDTVTQVQSHLIAQQYEGLIKKQRLRGR